MRIDEFMTELEDYNDNMVVTYTYKGEKYLLYDVLLPSPGNQMIFLPIPNDEKSHDTVCVQWLLDRLDSNIEVGQLDTELFLFRLNGQKFINSDKIIGMKAEYFELIIELE